MELLFINTNIQLADIFTKPLVEDRFLFLKEKLNIIKNPILEDRCSGNIFSFCGG